MAKRLKAISVAEAVNCCHQSDDSDLDSSAWGLSSDEEEKFVNVLTGWCLKFISKFSVFTSFMIKI